MSWEAPDHLREFPGRTMAREMAEQPAVLRRLLSGPLQLLAYEVTLARGQDPDAPRALAKVTETH
ncbi:hypothetical protein ACWD0Z_14270 [Streptomyces sp. NPDC003007]